MKKLLIILALLISLIAIPSYAYGAFNNTSDESIDIGLNVNTSSLNEIWAGVVEAFSFQESTVRMNSLIIDVGEDGSFDLLQLEFYAKDSQGVNNYYNISSHWGGKVSGWFHTTDDIFQRNRHLDILNKMDTLQMEDILGNNKQLHITFSQLCCTTFRHIDNIPYYHLGNGQLTPIESVDLRTDTYSDIFIVSRDNRGSEIWFA